MSNSWDLMEKWPKFLHIYTYYSNQITIIKMSINFCIICSLEILRYWFKKENFTMNITESGKSHYCYGNSHPFLSSPFPRKQRNLFLCTVDWPSTVQALLIFHYILIFFNLATIIHLHTTIYREQNVYLIKEINLKVEKTDSPLRSINHTKILEISFQIQH